MFSITSSSKLEATSSWSKNDLFDYQVSEIVDGEVAIQARCHRSMKRAATLPPGCLYQNQSPPPSFPQGHLGQPTDYRRDSLCHWFSVQESVRASKMDKKAALLIGGAGVAVLGLGLGYKYLRKPEKVVRVGVVSQLLIHPLKSGRAVSVALVECQKIGLKFGEMQDRHWLVVTEDGHMVTGRHEPRLVLVSLTCEGGQVCLNGPNMEELRFPVKQPDNPVIDCRVFRADIQGRDCGEEASQWLTRYLGAEKTFRLVHFEPQMRARRPVEKEPLFPQYEQVAYTDIAPVMLLSDASVKDLSSRLGKDVTVDRFRPNIVVGDCEAFDEDSWEEIQIGSVRLQRILSCGRCMFTTVDPETGIMNRKEPLETLKSYRLCKPSEKHIYKSSPLFGQLHTVKKTGILQVGDVVYKISR